MGFSYKCVTNRSANNRTSTKMSEDGQFIDYQMETRKPPEFEDLSFPFVGPISFSSIIFLELFGLIQVLVLPFNYLNIIHAMDRDAIQSVGSLLRLVLLEVSLSLEP